jgi:surface polysaccharide O-acyltransferase-like enzyme
MRALACILVIVVHTSGPFIQSGGPLGWASLPALLEAMSRPSVPMFFMISGYLALNDSRWRTGRVALKRTGRVLIPLVFYTIGYLAFCALVKLPLLNPFVGPVFYHLWYLYFAIGIALILMLVRPSELGPKTSSLIIAAVLVFGTGGLRHADEAGTFRIVTSAAVFLLYALAGYYLMKLPRVWFAALGATAIFAASTIVMAVLTERASVAAGTLDQHFYEYDRVLVAIQSLALFYAVTCLPLAIGASRAVQLVSGASFGIYALHPMFLHIALWYVPSDEVGMVVAAFVVFALALISALAIRKLPYGKSVA